MKQLTKAPAAPPTPSPTTPATTTPTTTTNRATNRRGRPLWKCLQFCLLATTLVGAHRSRLASCSLAAGPSYGSSLAATYESELMPTGSAGQHCVLTIKQQQQLNSSAHPAADPYSHHGHHGHGHSHNQLAAHSSIADPSYLADYVSSGRRGPYQHKGRTICITQHDVDLAVEEAKASLGGYLPREIYAANSELPKPMQVTVVAEIITQATRILANRFKLPEPAILYDLPAIDMSKSAAIDKVCPVFLKPGVNCDHSKYRTLTGYCNNLQYQSWGSTRSAMVRFLAPDYYDSISLPRRAYDGSPLPSARVVSFVVHQDPPEYDKYHSMLSVVWGQFIDHDMTLAVQATDENPTDGPDKIDCCASEDSHPDCFPIEIPKGDPFYGYFNQKCMHFTRASPGLQPGCSLGPVQAMNKLSSYMDGNLIYGSGIKTSQRLRTYHGGQLKSQPVGSLKAYGSSSAASDASSYAIEDSSSNPGHPLEQPDNSVAAEYLLAAGSRQHQAQRQAHGLDVSASMLEYSGAPNGAQYAPGQQQHQRQYKELLPANKHSPDTGCERRGRAKDVYCFEAGDTRANEQIQLTTMHTLFMREHNRVARELAYLNPYWDDERLFQEARQIVIAQLQHITFNEFLPLVIGKEKIYEYGLELEAPGRYYQGYDAKINAGIRVEFQAAAFRYGHSILPSYIERYNKYHQKIEAIRLSKLLKQPYDLYHPGVLDSYLLGLANQRSGRMDPTLSTEVTNHLFEKPGKFFGIDLAAINIQRGRDMGVPGYNHFREYCGLQRAKHFDDLTGVFSNKTLLRLAQLYKHVDDIDLWTAGISEYPIQDGLVGPTFACLIARQFVNLRRGDRFWYENAGYPVAQFTIEQLDELRKATSARIICDNSDDIETIQASPMLVADAYTNPRVPCHTLPQVDLAKWKETPAAAAGPPVAPHAPGAEHSAYAGDYAGEAEYPSASKLAEQAAAAAVELTAGHEAAEAASSYQPATAGELSLSEFEPIKTSSHHFVEHMVDSGPTGHYRPTRQAPEGDHDHDDAQADEQEVEAKVVEPNVASKV